MSDLQCPATFHVRGPGVRHHERLHGGAAPLDTYASPSRSGEVPIPGEARTLDVSRPLWDVLEELSDLYRGVHVLVLPAEVVPPLDGEADAVVVRIDADGRSVERP